jgi:hypothetical protein
MTNVGRRIERLEEKLEAKSEPRVIIVTNIDNPGNNSCKSKLSGHLWAYAARGGPFTNEEIRELREEHKGPAMPSSPWRKCS